MTKKEILLQILAEESGKPLDFIKDAADNYLHSLPPKQRKEMDKEISEKEAKLFRESMTDYIKDIVAVSNALEQIALIRNLQKEDEEKTTPKNIH